MSRSVPVLQVFACLLLLWLAPPSLVAAATITVTFDEADRIAAGDTLGAQYADLGVVFTPDTPPPGETAPSAPFVDWSTATDMTVVPAAGAGADVGDLGEPALASGNVLRSFTAWTFLEAGDPSFSAVFSTPITSLSATFAGIGGGFVEAANTRLLAYAGDVLVDDEFATRPSGLDPTLPFQQVLTVSSSTPITRVIFLPGYFDDYVAVDDITFTQVPAQVPEPATWLLAAIGLGGLRLAGRRR